MFVARQTRCSYALEMTGRGGGEAKHSDRSGDICVCSFLPISIERIVEHVFHISFFLFHFDSMYNQSVIECSWSCSGFGVVAKKNTKCTNDMFEWPSDSFEWLMIRLGQDIIRLADDYVYALVRPTELARRISQGARNQHQHHNRWLNLSHSNPNTLVHVAKETHLDTHSLAHL